MAAPAPTASQWTRRSHVRGESSAMLLLAWANALLRTQVVVFGAWAKTMTKDHSPLAELPAADFKNIECGDHSIVVALGSGEVVCCVAAIFKDP